MKYEVQLYRDNTVYYNTVTANSYEQAKQYALDRNPNATIIAITPRTQWN
jgi:hypothetical protein